MNSILESAAKAAIEIGNESPLQTRYVVGLKQTLEEMETKKGVPEEAEQLQDEDDESLTLDDL